MPMIHVTPAKGARVRMPERGSTVMLEQGAWVPDTVHYAGLIRTGDVVLSDPQPPMPSVSEAAQICAADAAASGKPQPDAPKPPVAPKEK